jgi:hypothetical protein
MKKLIIPRSLGRFRTCDVAFTYRMNAGFAGDVNRGHPASILPCLADPTTPPTAFGQPVVAVAATNGVRPLAAGDGGLTDIFGITVRPYPTQSVAAAAYPYGDVILGGGAPAVKQPVDVLRAGYIFVSVVGQPVKGGLVYIWTAASSGAHIQGGFESVAPGGSGIALPAGRFWWNSPPDNTGIAELAVVL